VDAESAITRFELVRNSVIPPELRMAEGRALSLYGVGEWGRLVRRGKYQTQPPRFDDQLVEACAQMLREWTPQKSPVWIVPIPSRRNNSLVGDFAERLARRLGMPCWRGLAKTIETPMQKEMESSAFQQNNVINAFAVKGQPPQGGCFLVDDMVDSRWTLTVASAVLREAGVEFVVPLALADSSYDGE
jgi:ATP-dependent DNA helicase RecQ